MCGPLIFYNNTLYDVSDRRDLSKYEIYAFQWRTECVRGPLTFYNDASGLDGTFQTMKLIVSMKD